MKLLRLLALGVFTLLALPNIAQETCASTSTNPWEWPGHNNWFFATNVYSGNILNFTTGIFTPMGDAFKPLQAYEGVSAASDDQGNLIFLTNGRDVIDKNGNKTFGGLLEGNENGGTANRGSASQGCMTVRHPLAPFDYYIFTTDDALSGTLGFNYGVMDENGNPKGGVTRLGTIRTTEGLTATFHENGVDIWIACQASGTDKVYAWLLTCDGIDLVNSPVISGGFANCTAGEERGGISFNWDGTQFVSAHPSGWPDKRVYVADFNKKTGQMTIESSSTPTNAFPYDVTFSPDNSHVIYSDNVGSTFSLDITSGNEATIAASKVLIASGGTGHSAIEIGADGNLYRSSLGGNNLTRLTGDLNGGTPLTSTNNLVGNTSRGLPTIYIPPAEEPNIDEEGPFCDDLDSIIDLHTYWICDGGSAEDTLYERNMYSGPGIIDPVYGHFNPSIAGIGIHEIIFEYCDVNDTIWIEVEDCPSCEVEVSDIIHELCVGETILLDTMVYENSADGIWTIDSVPSTVSVDATLIEGVDTIFNAANLNTKPGTYKLMYTVTDGANECKDSLYIIVNELPIVDLGNDTAICFGDPGITFDALNIGATYLWTPDGETDQTITKNIEGEYTVEVTNTFGCKDTDSVYLTIHALPIVDLGNDTAICFGDPAITFDAGNQTSTYLWSPGGDVSQTIMKDVEAEYSVEIVDTNGCEGTDTVYLTVNSLPIVDLGNDTAICLGDPTITFDAGNITSTYLWAPDGEISQTIVKDIESEYSVAIIDTNGCEGADTVYLTVNDLPVVDLGNDTTICLGDPAITFDAGNITATYLWAPDGETSQTIIKDVEAEYSVAILDTNGCAGADTVYLTVNALPIVDLGNDTAICIGDPAITFDAGNATATYLWASDGETSQTISKDIEAEYSVAILDTNGCAGADTIYLTVNALPIVDLGNDTAICLGDPAITFDAGNVTSTYLWASDGETSQIISKDIESEYSVAIVDTNGCAGADTIYLTVNTLPIVDLGNDTAICIGDPAITFDAGNTTSTYLWASDGEVSQTIVKDIELEYSVAIVDTNGCKGTDTVYLTVNSLPIVDLGNDTAICIGDPAITFDAKNTTSTYLWASDGEVSQTIVKDVESEYSVAIVDTNGCAGADTVYLTVNALPIVDLGNDKNICIGEAAVTFDAGNTTSTYLWTPNAETTQTIDTDVDGDYTVAIVDTNGCKGEDTVRLNVNTFVTVDLGNDTAICLGDAAIEFDAQSPGATYLWAPNGETTQTINKDVAGEYSVALTDVNGCKGTDTVVLIVNTLPVVDLGIDKEICIGDPAVSFDAGNVTATYLWAPNLEVVQVINTDVEGDYSVVIVDTNGCEGTDTVNLKVNDLPIVDLGIDLEICEIEPAVEIDAGNLTATYSWSSGEITKTIEIHTESDFNVVVTDTNGCIERDTIHLKINSMPVVAISDNEICFGDPAVDFDAGIGFDTYSWNNGAATQVMTTDQAGEYVVTFVDAQGCSGTDTVVLTVNTLPIPDLGVDQTICTDAPAAIFDAGVFTSYSWDSGETSKTINKTTVGTYTVEVTDANGCKGSDNADLIVIDLPTPDVILDISMCPGMNATLDASVYDNGNGAFTYAWHDGSTGNSFVANSEMSVWVDITDKFGCVGRDEAEVTVLNNLTVAIVGAPTIEICEGENVELIPNYKAVDGYLFTWDNGLTSETINVDQSGNYDLHVDNGAGCEGDATVEVVVNPLPIVSPSVAAICDGADVMIGNDQGASYIYSWDNGATTAQITVFAKGTYTQTVTHATQGCEASTIVEVSVNENPIPDLGEDITECEGVEVTLSDKSGTTDLTYLWSTDEGTASINPTITDNYILTVTTADGCSGTDDVNVTFLLIPTVDLGDDINLCEGESSSVDAGNDGLIITWNTGQNGASFTVDETNTHIVTVSNGLCSATDTIQVNVVPLPTSEIDHSLADELFCFEDVDRGIDITAGSNNAYTYLWGTGNTGGTLSATEAGTYVVNISVGNCFVTDNITLSEYCPSVLAVPNTFTPNGDGRNDSFNAIGSNITDYHMYIFNRWGELIYESESMTNDWDGTYKTRLVQIDTYVYKIYYSVNHPDGNPRKKQKVGHVNVLR